MWRKNKVFLGLKRPSIKETGLNTLLVFVVIFIFSVLFLGIDAGMSAVIGYLMRVL